MASGLLRRLLNLNCRPALAAFLIAGVIPFTPYILFHSNDDRSGRQGQHVTMQASDDGGAGAGDSVASASGPLAGLTMYLNFWAEDTGASVDDLILPAPGLPLHRALWNYTDADVEVMYELAAIHFYEFAGVDFRGVPVGLKNFTSLNKYL